MYVGNTLVALLKPAQYVRIKNNIIIVINEIKKHYAEKICINITHDRI